MMQTWTPLKTWTRDGRSVSMHKTRAANMLIDSFGLRGSIALEQITKGAEHVSALQVNMVAEAVQAAEARLALLAA